MKAKWQRRLNKLLSSEVTNPKLLISMKKDKQYFLCICSLSHTPGRKQPMEFFMNNTKVHFSKTVLCNVAMKPHVKLQFNSLKHVQISTPHPARTSTLKYPQQVPTALTEQTAVKNEVSSPN